MNTQLILTDADELKGIMERAFAGISSPLEAKYSAWTVLEQALAEAYALGVTNADVVRAQAVAFSFKAA